MPVTLVTLFRSYNQFYRAECITVSGFLTYNSKTSFVAKACNYSIFVAKNYDYALFCIFWGFAGFIDSAASCATLSRTKLRREEMSRKGTRSLTKWRVRHPCRWWKTKWEVKPRTTNLLIFMPAFTFTFIIYCAWCVCDGWQVAIILC